MGKWVASAPKPSTFTAARLLLELCRQGVQLVQRADGIALGSRPHIHTHDLQSRVQANAQELRALLRGLNTYRRAGMPEAAWWAHLEGVTGNGAKPAARRAVTAPTTDGKPALSDVLDDPPQLLPDTEPIAVDIETCGAGKLPLPWIQPSTLVCAGFSTAGRRFAYPTSDRAKIQRWLASPNPKVFHNAAYDLVWLCDAGFEIRGTLWPLAFENGAAMHGLRATGSFAYTAHLPKDTPDLAKVLSYCANDARNTLTVFDPVSRWCSHPLYRLYQRMAPRVAAVSGTGLPVFRDRVAARHVEATARWVELGAALAEFAPINWGSDSQVAAVLGDTLPERWTPKGQRKVDEAALRECRHPAAAPLLEWRRVGKLRSTYLQPFLQRDRVCGLISLNGARTGRTSSRYTNLQNIPRPLRSLFGDPACDWVKLDFAAAELVVAAVVAECTPLRTWFAEGKDPHAEAAARIFKASVASVTPEQRAVGKTLNFSLCYGGTAQTVLQRAASYGLSLSPSEAEAFREAWFATFPEMAAWQRAMTRTLERGEPIRSPFGRSWKISPHSSHERNMALNAPIQSAASDLLLIAADAVWDLFPGLVVNLVHDEIDVLIPKGTWDEAQWRAIARRMASVDARFPMRVEVALGPDWGSTRERFVEGPSA